MSAPQDNRSWNLVLLKWRDLAERRRAHLFELLESGRWQRYYSEELFLVRLHEAVGATAGRCRARGLNGQAFLKPSQDQSTSVKTRKAGRRIRAYIAISSERLLIGCIM